MCKSLKRVFEGAYLELQDRHDLIRIAYWGDIADPLEHGREVGNPDDKPCQKGREREVGRGQQHGQILIRHDVTRNDDALDAHERNERLTDHGQEDAAGARHKAAESVDKQPEHLLSIIMS
jgi:hypothetical protein